MYDKQKEIDNNHAEILSAGEAALVEAKNLTPESYKRIMPRVYNAVKSNADFLRKKAGEYRAKAATTGMWTIKEIENIEKKVEELDKILIKIKNFDNEKGLVLEDRI